MRTLASLNPCAGISRSELRAKARVRRAKMARALREKGRVVTLEAQQIIFAAAIAPAMDTRQVNYHPLFPAVAQQPTQTPPRYCFAST